MRLIVGSINLVEKIADLARRRGIPVPAPGTPGDARLRKESAKRAFDRAEAFADGVGGGRPKVIVKEGLIDDCRCSVEGTETIKNGWSKRMRAVKADDAKFGIGYRRRAHQYGPTVGGFAEVESLSQRS